MSRETKIKNEYLRRKGLTKREIEVVTLLCEKGLTNYQIGQELCVLDKTIKFHITSIYRKMKVKSCRDCIVKYYKELYLDASPVPYMKKIVNTNKGSRENILPIGSNPIDLEIL